jgi:hypothetical protein
MARRMASRVSCLSVGLASGCQPRNFSLLQLRFDCPDNALGELVLKGEHVSEGPFEPVSRLSSFR